MVVSNHSIGGCSIRVLTLGDGQPLLFLHGYDGHPGEAPFLQQLAKGYRVVAPELPGWGESMGLEAMDGVLDMTLFLRQLVESLAPSTADRQVEVVGHCLGGMLAAEFAAICPQLTRHLIIIDAFGLWLDEQPLPDPYTMKEGDLKAAKWHDPTSAPDPEPAFAASGELSAVERGLLRTQNLGSSTRFLWPIPDRGLRKRLPLISAPTLVLHGASDGLIPVAYAEELARLIPGAKLVLIPEAGHYAPLERPKEVAAEVDAFLN